MKPWRINVYRVPPRDDGTASQPAVNAADNDEERGDERDWRYADAVYEDVM